MRDSPLLRAVYLAEFLYLDFIAVGGLEKRRIGLAQGEACHFACVLAGTRIFPDLLQCKP